MYLLQYKQVHISQKNLKKLSQNSNYLVRPPAFGTTCFGSWPDEGNEGQLRAPRRRGPRRRDTSRPVTRMSTSARRAALSRVMVTPPDHQDSREHQLEGLRPGGGAEWTTAKNGGFCKFSPLCRLRQTFATSPPGAPRLTWQVSGTLSRWKSFNPRNSVSCTVKTSPHT